MAAVASMRPEPPVREVGEHKSATEEDSYKGIERGITEIGEGFQKLLDKFQSQSTQLYQELEEERTQLQNKLQDLKCKATSKHEALEAADSVEVAASTDSTPQMPLPLTGLEHFSPLMRFNYVDSQPTHEHASNFEAHTSQFMPSEPVPSFPPMWETDIEYNKQLQKTQEVQHDDRLVIQRSRTEHSVQPISVSEECNQAISNQEPVGAELRSPQDSNAQSKGWRAVVNVTPLPVPTTMPSVEDAVAVEAVESGGTSTGVGQAPWVDSAHAKIVQRIEAALTTGPPVPPKSERAKDIPANVPAPWSPTTWASVATAAKEKDTHGPLAGSPPAGSPPAPPAAPKMLAKVEPKKEKPRAPEPSKSLRSGVISPGGSAAIKLELPEIKRMLSAIWEGSRGETYELRLHNDYHWTCMRKDSEGQKGFPLRFDSEHSYIWWGQSYFLDPMDFLDQPNVASWYLLTDTSKQRAKFVWRRIREDASDIPIGKRR